jgi:protein dithiol:quinone oxidoreductase
MAKKTYFLGLLIISFLLLTSLYLQFFAGVLPCPLCTLQRLTFLTIGLCFLIGIFVHSKLLGRLIINLSVGSLSVLGLFLAGRQVYLQHLPPNANAECGASIQYMLQVLSLDEVLKKILQGSTECAKRGWEFLSLNMAEWSLIWFSVLFLMCIYLLWRERNI